MKNIILPLLLLMLNIYCNNTLAVSPDELLKIKPKELAQYPKSLKTNQVFLKMEFASAKTINRSQVLREIEGAAIQKIDLLYSSFKTSPTFNQPALNKNRYQVLLKMMPDLKDNNLVKWGVYVQTGAKDDTQAKELMHGFIITYFPKPTKKLTVIEMTTMKDALEAVEIVPDPEKTEEIKVVKTRKKTRFTGKYEPRSAKKRAKGILYNKRSIWNRPMQRITNYDTLNRYKTIVHYKSTKGKTFTTFAMPDTVIFSVLERNKEWNDISFICDVTGSMSPYSTQIMLWHKLNFNSKRAKYFTFFNDGDNKRESSKRIGSIGGIYSVEANTYQDVEDKIFHAMSQGNGGDAPENDLEALIEAIDKYPDAKEVVLIADNWSKIKDYKLLEKINKPVRVILCGFFGGVNLDYLNLAYETGGSIHTIEQDITDLMKMQNGESIKIGDQRYVIRSGKFVLSEEM